MRRPQPNRAETTVYGYNKIIDNHISPALGDITLQKLTPQDIQKYYTMLMREKGLSPNTVRRHHDLLSSALRMAVKQEVLSRCPTDRVEPPRVVPFEAKFYGPEDLRRLCLLSEGTWLEVVVKLAAGLGLRREEICGLRWPNVDFNQRVVRIKEARTAAGASIIQKTTKTRSSTRTLYLSDSLYNLLLREQQRQQQECEPGLHPVHPPQQHAQDHPPRPAAHLRHRGLRPGSAPFRHRQGPGPLHPLHHRPDLHPPAGPDPRPDPGPGGRRDEVTRQAAGDGL